MLVYADGNVRSILKANPQLDREATTELVKKLFRGEKLEPLPEDGDLYFTSPPDNEIVAGCFKGLSVVAAKEFGIDNPCELESRFIDASGDKSLYLHAMHSVVDWFAFAIWRKGKLQRALSLSPDSGIIVDTGAKLEFEKPYWAGEHPAGDPDEDDDYPFPFHPLDLGEAALLDLFGYQIEGVIDSAQVRADEIALMRFKRSKSIFKFW